ncbi:MAG: hypothetical protein ACRC6N_11330 [Plesiomonas sp.]|uniref:hypothetical protein n=1 Tax=Plesiomonas sp. TaxID=2486279 RepID=UPI003F37CEA1
MHLSPEGLTVSLLVAIENQEPNYRINKKDLSTIRMVAHMLTNTIGKENQITLEHFKGLNEGVSRAARLESFKKNGFSMKLVEFDCVRAWRNEPAAKMRFCVGMSSMESDHWIDISELQYLVKENGAHPELIKAINAYCMLS